MPKIRGLASSAICRELSFDELLANVIGGNGEEPVAVEFIVQLLQVIEGSAGGLDHVPAAVVPPGLFEAETHARTGDELPEAGGLAARIGKRLVGAFDHRQQSELG